MIGYSTEKEPKLKFFDFGAFQKIKKMVSREKIIFHEIFWASHGTPRIIISSEINKVIGNKQIIYFTEIFDHANLETFWAQKYNKLTSFYGLR